VTAVVALAAACGGSEAPEVPEGAEGEPDPVLVQGRDVFTSRCRSCHGTSGGGGVGPSLRSERIVAEYPDIADQIEVISEGRDGMPSFGDTLSDEEIEAVARYTREVL